MTRRGLALTALALTVAAFAGCLRPATARASLDCSAINDANGIAGKACQVLSSPKKIVSAGKKLLSGHIGSAVKTVVSGGATASTASTALGLTAIVTWVITGAKFALTETTKLLGETTTPQLRTSWFSATYWRIAGIAAVLTLPFLFAAATQALVRSDVALLARAALGYLPLAMLAVGIAAPLTMLLLAATDQLCAAVSAAGGGGIQLDFGRMFAGAILEKAPFLVFLIGVVTTSGAVALWLELAIREAAVYVIVLMLPLAFAAFVWPSRRIWAVRAVELLVALILSKFAIVAVLTLGGAALDRLGHFGLNEISAALGGTVLVLLAVFSPWAVLRLLPMSEVAGAAVGSLRPGLRGELGQLSGAQAGAKERIAELAEGITAHMKRQADDAELAAEPGGDRRDGRAGASVGARDGETRAEQAERLAALAAGGEGPQTAGAESNGTGPGENGTGPGENGAGAAHDDAPMTAASSGGSASGDQERIPGLPLIYQADDLSWRPLPLGPDGDWDSPLWTPPGEGQRTDGEVPGMDGRPSPGMGGQPTGPGAADDSDPLPPRQERDEGSL